MHIVVDTLGHLLVLKAKTADQGDRDQVVELAKQVRELTGNSVELTYVGQGYTGPAVVQAA